MQFTRKTALLLGAASIAAQGLTSAPTRAANPGDLVPIFLGTTRTTDSFGNSITSFKYTVMFTPSSPGDSIVDGDFITFNDVYQLSGAGAGGPTAIFLTPSIPFTSPTSPGTSLTDSASLRNVLITYAGTASVTTASTFPTYSFNITSYNRNLGLGLLPFADQYHDATNSLSGGQGFVLGPVAAPEPSSVAAFAFTGLGVAGLMLRARKRAAA